MIESNRITTKFQLLKKDNFVKAMRTKSPYDYSEDDMNEDIALIPDLSVEGLIKSFFKE